MIDTRVEIGPYRMTWWDDYGLYHCVRVLAHCIDTAWPWWRPGHLWEDYDAC